MEGERVLPGMESRRGTRLSGGFVAIFARAVYIIIVKIRLPVCGKLGIRYAISGGEAGQNIVMHDVKGVHQNATSGKEN